MTTNPIQAPDVSQDFRSLCLAKVERHMNSAGRYQPSIPRSVARATAGQSTGGASVSRTPTEQSACNRFLARMSPEFKDIIEQELAEEQRRWEIQMSLDQSAIERGAAIKDLSFLSLTPVLFISNTLKAMFVAAHVKVESAKTTAERKKRSHSFDMIKTSLGIQKAISNHLRRVWDHHINSFILRYFTA